MKKFLSLLGLPLVSLVAIPCGCSSSSSTADNIINIVNTGDAKESATDFTTSYSTVNEAASGYKPLVEAERFNILMYSMFNFIGKDGFTLYGKNITEETKSLIDYKNDKTVSMDFTYNYDIDDASLSSAGDTVYFDFTFIGYLQINFNKDISGLAMGAGDYLTVMYEVENKNGKCTYTKNDTAEANNLWYFTPTYSIASNDLDPAFGFINWTCGGQSQPLLSITDMADMNFAPVDQYGTGHDFIWGYFHKKSA